MLDFQNESSFYDYLMTLFSGALSIDLTGFISPQGNLRNMGGNSTNIVKTWENEQLVWEI